MDAELLDRLEQAARAIAPNAYCPYSGFRVGAAVVDRQQRIHVGCNVENASYGLTGCAERAALTAAIVAGVPAGEIDHLVIYTPGRRSYTSCGACRQVMVELMSPESRIVSISDEGDRLEFRLASLLPDAFRLED